EGCADVARGLRPGGHEKAPDWKLLELEPPGIVRRGEPLDQPLTHFHFEVPRSGTVWIEYGSSRRAEQWLLDDDDYWKIEHLSVTLHRSACGAGAGHAAARGGETDGAHRNTGEAVIAVETGRGRERVEP